MRTTFFAIAAGLALSTAAFAAEPQQTAAAQPIAATDDLHRVVCHYTSHEGLLLPRQVCMTKLSWDRTREVTEQALWDIELRSYSRPR